MKKSIFFLIVFILSGLALSAQDRGMKAVEIPVEGKPTTLYQGSFALVIGVTQYSNGWSQLPGVKDEIAEVKQALEKNGFKVEVVMDPTKSELDKAFTDFISRNGQVVDNRLLFYFAGHGYTVKTNYGEELGYIVPVDAPNPNYDLAKFQSQAMEMAQIEIYARRLQAKHALFIFDACFSGSLFTSTRAVPAIISYKTTLPVRQFITSGSAEEMVPDKSVFGEQFVRALKGEADVDKDGYVTGSELGDFLQSTVVNYSRNSQHPQYGKIRSPNLDKGDFVFPITGESTGTLGAAPATTTNVQPAAAAITTQPAGTAAVRPAEKQEAATVASAPPAAKPSKKRGKEKDAGKKNEVPPPVEITPETTTNDAFHVANDFIPMIHVDGGPFDIGGNLPRPPSPGFPKPGASSISKSRLVTMKSFYIGKFEVTQKQWREITGSNPSYTQNCDECPVEQVSYVDIQVFLNALNQKTGKKYRLPTEAEWEYAAQGGNNSKDYSFAGGKDADDVGWYEKNAGRCTHAVGQKQPNELGIYDMSGNVFEWCNDWFSATYYYPKSTFDPQGPDKGNHRVIRGGGYKNRSGELKITFRKGLKPDDKYPDVGFRIVREE
ncbi:MAG: SUMF1/EgtB/PvdO family nonheme iron enzyme [Bacteroidales bacterium]|nr:SUMF1/EgtB/PvdO family nonheme iron enzyme [Bacteroidales bacterium]